MGKLKWVVMPALLVVALFLIAVYTDIFNSNRLSAEDDGGTPTPAPSGNAPEQIPTPKSDFPKSPLLATKSGITFMQQIGGSGDDEILDAVSIGNAVFVFGKTESKDYDFYGQNGSSFIGVLDGSILKNVACFDGKYLGSKTHSNGVFVFSQSGESLVVINYDTKPNIVSTLNVRVDGEVRQVGSYYVANGVICAVLYSDKLMILGFDNSLNKRFEYITDCSESTSVTQFLPTGKDFIALLNTDGNVNALVIDSEGRIKTNRQILVNHTVSAFVPTVTETGETEYGISATNGTTTSVILYDSYFSLKSVRTFSACSESELVPLKGHYLFFDYSNTKVYAYSGDGITSLLSLYGASEVVSYIPMADSVKMLIRVAGGQYSLVSCSYDGETDFSSSLESDVRIAEMIWTQSPVLVGWSVENDSVETYGGKDGIVLGLDSCP